MSHTPEQKQQMVARYRGGLATAPHAILVSFKGLTVSEATDLRARVRAQGGHYEVVKNTLVLRAVEGRGLSQLKEQFQGPTAVAYTEDDPVALAKTLTEFRKQVPAIEFKGALVDGQAVEGSEVEAIARMPDRQELIAKLLFLLQSPITRLVRGLAAIPRELVIVLDQIAKKKGDG